jgi:hypothetical protein
MIAILITLILLLGLSVATRRRRGNCRRRRRPLTIHHRTYLRLGHEHRSDIQVLCWRCHRRNHTLPRPCHKRRLR